MSELDEMNYVTICDVSIHAPITLYLFFQGQAFLTIPLDPTSDVTSGEAGP